MMHPRNAYEILSFQNERYPYEKTHVKAQQGTHRDIGRQRTCLSLIPSNSTSSKIVKRGILFPSPSVSKSRGSNAIFPPPSSAVPPPNLFAPPLTPFGVPVLDGDDTDEPVSGSPSVVIDGVEVPTRRRESPDVAIAGLVFCVGQSECGFVGGSLARSRVDRGWDDAVCARRGEDCAQAPEKWFLITSPKR